MLNNVTLESKVDHGKQVQADDFEESRLRNFLRKEKVGRELTDRLPRSRLRVSVCLLGTLSES